MIINNSDANIGTTLKLDGFWDYELDYEDKGLSQEWFNRSLNKSNFILPGTTTSNSVGDPLKMRAELNKESVRCLREKFKFLGAAWYQRKVEIPKAWQGKSIFLFLERVIFASTLWINGKQVASQDSLSVPHNYDISKYIKDQSECVITLRIDNRDINNIGPNSSGYTDETQTIWNGVIGSIELLAKDKINISNIQIYPKFDNKIVKCKVMIDNNFQKKAEVYLAVKILNKEGKTVYSNSSTELSYIIEEKINYIEFSCKVNDEIIQWDEFSPEVYSLELKLEGKFNGKKYTDIKTEKFGMREFKADGTQFIINNKKTFLRGTIECCIFPLTGFPPMDKDSWINIFTTIKSYGLNHLRFHSWCPPEVAFDVADEKGVYISVEAPMWMDTWTGYEVGSYPEHYSYLPSEVQRIINTYGNHPSFCMFSNGNELNGDFKLLHDMIISLKEVDNRRVYTLTSNWDRDVDEADDFFVAQTVDGVGIRGQYFMDKLVEGTNLDYNSTIKLRNMPIVSHEIGQYVVYPDMEEISEYSGVLRPINFESIRNDLESKGMLKYAKDFTMGSGKLAAQLYKDEIEAALRTEGFGGFQLLGLHDFPGQSTATVGLLNCFWKSKGLISESNFREFCSSIVPLLRIDNRIYNNDEKFNGDIQISNFSSVDLKDSTINWDIKLKDGNVFASGNFTGICIPQGTLVSIGKIKAISFEAIHKASQLTVTIGIDGTDIRNQWNIWVYPKEDDILKNNDIVIATRMDKEVKVYLEQGKKVLILPEAIQVKEAYPGRFFPVFWSPVHFVTKDPCGLFCKSDHPVFNDFPTDYYASYQWKKLLEDSFTIYIDEFPEEFEPIVQIIPNFYNNHRMTNLFEAKVGAGKLLVCSINLKNNIENSKEKKQLFRSITKYMNSENFNPEKELNIDDLKNI